MSRAGFQVPLSFSKGMGHALKATPKTKQVINLSFMGDTQCYWSYIAKRRLDRAMLEMENGDSILFKTRWVPAFVDISLPMSPGVDRQEHLTKQCATRSDFEKARSLLVKAGKEVDIDFCFTGRLSNSLASHRLILWAADSGLHMDLADAIFHRGLEQGEDIGDHNVLASAAKEVGFSEQEAKAFLGKGFGQDVQELVRGAVHRQAQLVMDAGKYGDTSATATGGMGVMGTSAAKPPPPPANAASETEPLEVTEASAAAAAAEAEEHLKKFMLPRVAVEPLGEVCVGPYVDSDHLRAAFTESLEARSWSPWVQAKRIIKML